MRNYYKQSFTGRKSELYGKLCRFADNNPFFTLLDGNGSAGPDLCCGWEVVNNFRITDFDQLADFQAKNKDWLFGHLAYDLKNQLEKTTSNHHDRIGFPELHFYQPRFVVQLKAGELFLGYMPGDEKQAATVYSYLLETNNYSNDSPLPKAEIPLNIEAGSSRENYISQVSKLLQHIARGDIYEINYCIEFFAENAALDPVACFDRLNKKARAPFSALYRVNDNWLMCASPERYLKKEGSKITSQPIKGTIRRGADPVEDEQLKQQLFLDPKERCENVMIVDLVRNDLSKIAAKGTVKVDELFGVYAFETVHQLISTVSATVKTNVSATEVLKATFPMGSMTGAPKLRAMELAEEHENVKRGLYSGALGYFTPEGDFDFNVVIRSIQYNATSGSVSLMVGSAITHYASPEKEYEECLLKAAALFEALGVRYPASPIENENFPDNTALVFETDTRC